LLSPRAHAGWCTKQTTDRQLEPTPSLAKPKVPASADGRIHKDDLPSCAYTATLSDLELESMYLPIIAAFEAPWYAYTLEDWICPGDQGRRQAEAIEQGIGRIEANPGLDEGRKVRLESRSSFEVLGPKGALKAGRIYTLVWRDLEGGQSTVSRYPVSHVVAKPGTNHLDPPGSARQLQAALALQGALGGVITEKLEPGSELATEITTTYRLQPSAELAVGGHRAAAVMTVGRLALEELRQLDGGQQRERYGAMMLRGGLRLTALEGSRTPSMAAIAQLGVAWTGQPQTLVSLGLELGTPALNSSPAWLECSLKARVEGTYSAAWDSPVARVILGVDWAVDIPGAHHGHREAP